MINDTTRSTSVRVKPGQVMSGQGVRLHCWVAGWLAGIDASVSKRASMTLRCFRCVGDFRGTCSWPGPVGSATASQPRGGSQWYLGSQSAKGTLRSLSGS